MEKGLKHSRALPLPKQYRDVEKNSLMEKGLKLPSAGTGKICKLPVEKNSLMEKGLKLHLEIERNHLGVRRKEFPDGKGMVAARF